MAFLKSSDFNKTASGGVYAGETRDKIFELKIKDKKPLFLDLLKMAKR